MPFSSKFGFVLGCVPTQWFFFFFTSFIFVLNLWLLCAYFIFYYKTEGKLSPTPPEWKGVKDGQGLVSCMGHTRSSYEIRVFIEVMGGVFFGGIGMLGTCDNCWMKLDLLGDYLKFVIMFRGVLWLW